MDGWYFYKSWWNSIPFISPNLNPTVYLRFKKLIDEKKYALIDLRTDDELKNKGYIKGATQIDWFGKNSEAIISKLDKKKTYYLYCAGGGRSADAADILVKKGFKNVVNLVGGFTAWKKSNLEVEVK